MKKRSLALLLIISLTGTLFAGCGTNSGQPNANEESVMEPTPESSEIPDSAEEPNIPVEPTEIPELADAPATTVVPTNIPNVKEEPIATSTPIPTAAPEPTVVPEPTTVPEPTEKSEVIPVPTTTPIPKSIYTYSELNKTMYAKSTVNVRTLPSTDGNKIGSLSANDKVTVTGKCNETGWYQIVYNNETAYVSNDYLVDNLPTPTPKPTQKPTSDRNSASNTEEFVFPVYPCGEKGAEVLELAKSLREKYPTASASGLEQFISLHYNYSEQDILYGVYNSGCEKDCNSIIAYHLENQIYISRHHLIEIFVTIHPYIEKDVMSAIDNYGIDWNEQAVKCFNHLLNANGRSYEEFLDCVYNSNFTAEQIEYAFNAVNPNWNEQAAKKANYYITSVPSGISYPDLVDALTNSHKFEKEQVEYAMNSIKDVVDWNEQAYKMAQYFAPYKNSKNELIIALEVNNFTDEQIKYAINKIGW